MCSWQRTDDDDRRKGFLIKTTYCHANPRQRPRSRLRAGLAYPTIIHPWMPPSLLFRHYSHQKRTSWRNGIVLNRRKPPAFFVMQKCATLNPKSAKVSSFLGDYKMLFSFKTREESPGQVRPVEWVGGMNKAASSGWWLDRITERGWILVGFSNYENYFARK